jgi:hypothetical protein
MPRGRPRTSHDPHATRSRTLADVELASAAPAMPKARESWRDDTVTAFETYARSEAARALRSEDTAAVFRLFDYLDRRAAWWDSVPESATAPRAHEAITAIKSLESMIQSLANSIGLGPRARRDLGILTEVKPGSRLDAFIHEGA